MSTAASYPLSPGEPIFRLTVKQYHEMIRSGMLTEDDPVELVEGILLFKMPKKSAHTTCNALLRRVVEPLLSSNWHYRPEQPITLDDGEPEPDGAIVRGQIEDYATAHPRAADVALVIETADTTLDRDRGIKLRSYARAGIGTCGIVNLVNRQVEVFADPDADAKPAPTYRQPTVYRHGDSIPLHLGGADVAQVSVSSILPPA
jgi:Uma2 family endonuclease